MSNFKIDLQKAETLQQFIDVIQKHYDTENCKLGFLNKPMLISGIDKVIAISAVKPRKK